MVVFVRLWLLAFSLLCLFCLAAGGASAAELRVVIVSPDRSGAYLEASHALLDELASAGVSRSDTQHLTVAEWMSAGPGAPSPKLFITLGVEATGALAKSKNQVPVLATLLPRVSFERVLRDSGRQASPKFTALYLNQPLSRQLELVRLSLPKVRRVGVLWGPESRVQEPELEAAVAALSFQLISAQVAPGETLFTGLKKVLDDAEVLLAMADPLVYNASNIQNILSASYRAQVPVLAFSPAYVRAGALLALFSTPVQLGQQAGGMARRFLQGHALALPEYPQKFTITVNEPVARSLGLNLDAQDVGLRLQRLERRP